MSPTAEQIGPSIVKTAEHISSIHNTAYYARRALGLKKRTTTFEGIIIERYGFVHPVFSHKGKKDNADITFALGGERLEDGFMCIREKVQVDADNTEPSLTVFWGGESSERIYRTVSTSTLGPRDLSPSDDGTGLEINAEISSFDGIFITNPTPDNPDTDLDNLLRDIIYKTNANPAEIALGLVVGVNRASSKQTNTK